MLIESQQVLYRGDYFWPTELWNVNLQKWEPYEGQVPKEIGWGDVVSASEAKVFMSRLVDGSAI